MPLLTFGDFAPDQPSVNDQVLRRAENVLFHGNKYIPLPGKGNNVSVSAPTGVSSATGYSVVLTAAFSKGAHDAVVVIVVQRGAGEAKILIFNRGTLYDIPSHADNPTHTLLPSDRWRVVQYGEAAFIASKGNFLFEVPFNSYESGYIVRHQKTGELLTVVRDRLLHAGDPATPFRVYFSGVNLATFDPAHPTNPGGLQDIPDHGAVTALTGGEVGHVFSEYGIDRLTETDDEVVYQRDNVSQEVGCRDGGWAYRVGNKIFFHSHNGFKRITDNELIEDIGHGRFDLWMEQISRREQQSVVHWADISTLIFFQQEGFVVAYNYIEDRMTHITSEEIDWHAWTTYKEPGVSIDDPRFKTGGTGTGDKLGWHTIDDPAYEGVRIDDLRWGRGKEKHIEVRLVGSDIEITDIVLNRLADEDADTFTPPDSVGVIQTGEVYAATWLEAEQDERHYRHRGAIPPSNRMFTSEGRLVGQLYVEGADMTRQNVSVAIAARDHEYEPAFDFGAETVVPQGETLCAWMASGRYVSFRITLDGEWTYLTGIEVSISDDGQVTI